MRRNQVLFEEGPDGFGVVEADAGYMQACALERGSDLIGARVPDVDSAGFGMLLDQPEGFFAEVVDALVARQHAGVHAPAAQFCQEAAVPGGQVAFLERAGERDDIAPGTHELGQHLGGERAGFAGGAS